MKQKKMIKLAAGITAAVLMTPLFLTVCKAEENTNYSGPCETIKMELNDKQVHELTEAGLVSGVKEYTIAEGTALDMEKLLFFNTSVVEKIEADDSKANYSKEGTYDVTYTITVDSNALSAFESDQKTSIKIPKNCNQIVGIVKSKQTVVKEEKAKTAEIITNANVQAYSESSQHAVSNYDAGTKVAVRNNTSGSNTKTETKPNASAPNVPASKPNNTSSGNSGNTGNTKTEPQTQKPTQPATSQSTPSQPATQPPTQPETTHHHSYSKVIASQSATCTTPGSVTFQCSCGDTITNTTTPATGHSWVAATHTEDHGYYEDIQEWHQVCNGCGMIVEGLGWEELGAHLSTCGPGSYKGAYVVVGQRWVPNTVEVTDYYYCTVCGAKQ